MLNFIYPLVLVVASSVRIKHATTKVTNHTDISLFGGKTGSQPLDKKQCQKAASRIEGKNAMMAEVALTGYLREIGQKPTKKLIKSVQAQIKGGCEVPDGTPQVSSDAGLLNHDECLEAKARTEGKEGLMLEIVLKTYLKEIKRKPSNAMIELVTKQIDDDCPVHSAKPLNTLQCLAVKARLQKSNSSFMAVTQNLIGAARLLGKESDPQTFADICQQVSGPCGGKSASSDKTPSPLEIPASPPTGPSTKEPKAEIARLLNPEECHGAEKAIEGKSSIHASLHLGTYLRSIKKKSDPKTLNRVMKELKKGCDSGESVEVDQDASVDTDDAEITGVKKEGPPEVSSGTIRRLDFVDDQRFAKYRMMYKIKQPEGAVRGRLTMDSAELLKSGLTEEELACFVELLYRKVDECDVAPKTGASKVLTPEFLKDPRLKKYAMMKKIRQPRGAVEGRLTMDKAGLLKDGLTEAELDCFLKLLFDEVKKCDATPLGKILDSAFVEKEDFTKYKKMHKMKMPRGAVEGRIRMDMKELEGKGYSKAEMECFLKLLFEETDKCPIGPAGRAESQSKEARGLAVAKATHETFASLLDGNDGLMPPELPDIAWATSAFEIAVPKQAKKEKKKPTKDVGEKPTLESYVDSKVSFNLNILLKKFPEKPWGGYIAELGRGAFSLDKQTLELFQRAISMVDDTLAEEVKPNLAKITDEHDDSHQFVKNVVEVKYGKDAPPLDDIVQCLISKEEYAIALGHRAESLATVQAYYKATSMAVGTFSSAAAGFVYQILNARLAVADEGREEVDKANIAEYDTMLRKFRNDAGESDGGETVAAIVPLLALVNVLIKKDQRLRPALAKKLTADEAATFSPLYLDLFKAYFQGLVDAESAVEEVEEPLLSYEDCVALQEVLDANKNNAMFREMAVDKFLKQRKLKKQKGKVLAQLEKKGCVKPVGGGPLEPEECLEALKVYQNAPNAMMQGIKLTGYVRSIGKYKKYSAAEKQVKDGCPSGDAPAPKFVYSDLENLCKTITTEFPEPSFSNSVRGASSGVGETLQGIEHCLATLPPSSHDSFSMLQEEAGAVLDLAKSMQETVFDTIIQASGPFLPHNSKGDVDKKAMKDLMGKLPKAGGEDDSKRIRGANSIQSKYTLVDFLDDESLRHATRLMCTSLFS